MDKIPRLPQLRVAGVEEGGCLQVELPVKAPKSLPRFQLHLYEMTNRFSVSGCVLWSMVQQNHSATGGSQGYHDNANPQSGHQWKRCFSVQGKKVSSPGERKLELEQE